MNKVLFYRQKLNFTQTELSERSGLSLRTIQRIESGAIPKGHTLKLIAKALDLETDQLIESRRIENGIVSDPDFVMMKFINISALSFVIFPFGNLIFPLLIWHKNKRSPAVNEIGLQIINLQIFWTFAVSILLCISPIFQRFFLPKFPLLLFNFVVLAAVNIFLIFKNAKSLRRKKSLAIRSPIAIL